MTKNGIGVKETNTQSRGQSYSDNKWCRRRICVTFIGNTKNKTVFIVIAMMLFAVGVLFGAWYSYSAISLSFNTATKIGNGQLDIKQRIP